MSRLLCLSHVGRAGADGVSTAQFEPLSAVAAGEYVIEVNAKTPAGSAQDTFAFRCTAGRL